MQVLADGGDITTMQLTKLLYGANTVSNRAALRQLRGRVQDKLLNHLFFLDHSDGRLLVSRRYEIECLDLLHKVTILFLEGEYQLCERLLRRCLQSAREGDFTAYAELAAQRLRALYADRSERLKYQAIDKELHELRQTLKCEQEAEQIVLDIRLAMLHTVASRQKALPTIPIHLARLEKLHKQAGTYTTYQSLYRLRIIYAELNGNYVDIIELTEHARQQIAAGNLNVRRFDERFNHFMSIYAHLRGRQPATGLKLAETFVQDIHPTSGNWFYFYEHYVLLALHAGDYEKALRLLQTAHKNPSYQKQRPAALARWELLEAYTELVQPADRLPVHRRSQLAVFAALTVPEYTRDKRGYNVAILIFQFLHFLRQRVLEAVLTRLERLRKYQQRHLRDAAALRSRTFLRLLLLLPDANFNAVELEKRGANLLAQLHQAPPVGEAEAEIEIIPYEDLWSFTLSTLRRGTPE